eukprot:598278-Hanusia_phi.AAC.8
MTHTKRRGETPSGPRSLGTSRGLNGLRDPISTGSRGQDVERKRQREEDGVEGTLLALGRWRTSEIERAGAGEIWKRNASTKRETSREEGGRSAGKKDNRRQDGRGVLGPPGSSSQDEGKISRFRGAEEGEFHPGAALADEELR